MNKEIKIIDPAQFVAKELYEALEENSLLNKNGDIRNSEFFISVPNLDNKSIEIDENVRFTYDYKYGRDVGEIQEYIKVVPFSRNNISSDIIERFKLSIPTTFELIRLFNFLVKRPKVCRLLKEFNREITFPINMLPFWWSEYRS